MSPAANAVSCIVDGAIFSAISAPTIYAYSDTRYPDCLKIGYTTRHVAARMREHYPTKTPSQSHRVEGQWRAITQSGELFTDHAVHKKLIQMGIKRQAGEWFCCDVAAVENAIASIQKGRPLERERTQTFAMRPEQARAVAITANYFASQKQDNPSRPPRFLWNAKMRFGKTFAAYQLAKKMGWQKIFVMSYKTAVKNAWETDLIHHADFDGWQFITREGDLTYRECDKTRPIVLFGSFQDFMGRDKYGNIKPRNEWAHEINWDCVIVDEYHFGAWRERAKEAFEDDDSADLNIDMCDLPITTNHYLYLSGTPFRALATGEFIEEQIFNWTYSDEQKAKRDWVGDNNPYLALPQLKLLTYKLPQSVENIAEKGQFNEFDLSEFFKSDTDKNDLDNAAFKYESAVQKWLDLIRDNLDDLATIRLKQGGGAPPLPFADVRLLGNLLHTVWFLPSVASCYAMKNLLERAHNRFYRDYAVLVIAGSRAGSGADALKPVQAAMGDNPLATKSIVLTCGKLLTGVSVAPWTGIFMLRNLNSPETYFQAAFRVQTPWVLTGGGQNEGATSEIIKNECYIFDFAPHRALNQIVEYSQKLNTSATSPEQKVAELIEFLPVLAYDGSAMEQVDAGRLLDMAMSGTTATLLAKRWKSAELVNVDNDTLRRIMANDEALAALEKIEDFRAIQDDIQTIINKSEVVKDIKKQAADRSLSKAEKKELTAEEKREKVLRREIQEKLIKFATRVPIFMYLSDYREHSLEDVVRELEPELFTRVTGLSQRDFELLVELEVFNKAMMNDAVYKFKRYEDGSLGYAEVDGSGAAPIGVMNTVVRLGELD